MNADARGDSGFTGKRRDGTGRPRRGRRPIASPRTATATGYSSTMRERWMTSYALNCIRGLELNRSAVVNPTKSLSLRLRWHSYLYIEKPQ
jgi:hypothetical protein